MSLHVKSRAQSPRTAHSLARSVLAPEAALERARRRGSGTPLGAPSGQPSDRWQAERRRNVYSATSRHACWQQESWLHSSHSARERARARRRRRARLPRASAASESPRHAYGWLRLTVEKSRRDSRRTVRQGLQLECAARERCRKEREPAARVSSRAAATSPVQDSTTHVGFSPWRAARRLRLRAVHHAQPDAARQRPHRRCALVWRRALAAATRRLHALAVSALVLPCSPYNFSSTGRPNPVASTSCGTPVST